MGTWTWPNILAVLLFFGCWAGVSRWHRLHHRNDEMDAKQAAAVAEAGIVEDIPDYAGSH